MENKISLNIGGLPFTGEPLEKIKFFDVESVYVVIGVNPDHNWSYIDSGLLTKDENSIDSIERLEKWKQKYPVNNIWVCKYEMPDGKYNLASRERLLKDIKKLYSKEFRLRLTSSDE
jgi:hypothetical protein